MCRPDRERLRGFFEHAVFPRQLVIWPFRTLALALTPGRFWSRVRLAMRPVVGRILCWPLIVIFLPWALSGVIASGTIALLISRRVPLARWSDYEWATLLNMWIWPFATASAGSRRPFAPASFWIDLTPLGYMIISALGAIAAWPLVMLLLGETLREARLRRSHLLRAAVYGLAPLSLIASVRVVYSFVIVAEAVTAVSPWRSNLFPIWAIDSRLQFGVLVVLLAWLGVWWRRAIMKGFRLKHAAAVWALILIISILTALAVAEYSGPWLRWTIMEFFFR